MDPRQTTCPFEVLNDMPIIPGTADIGYAEKADQFLFGHNSRVWSEPAILGRYGTRWRRVFVHVAHNALLTFFCCTSTRRVRDFNEGRIRALGAPGESVAKSIRPTDQPDSIAQIWLNALSLVTVVYACQGVLRLWPHPLECDPHDMRGFRNR